MKRFDLVSIVIVKSERIVRLWNARTGVASRDSESYLSLGERQLNANGLPPASAHLCTRLATRHARL